MGWRRHLWHPSNPSFRLCDGAFLPGQKLPYQVPTLALLSLVPSPENCCDTGTAPRDHMMRQTPVCPARQWELPLALTGTMTSDLKFLERKCSSSRL